MENVKALKCVACGTIIRGDEPVYRVMRYIATNKGMERVFSPACSSHCANATRAENAHYFEGILNEVKYTSVQKTTANDYFDA